MTKRALHVSDHAVLRYLERVGGFEIDALRAEIASRVGQVYASGASNVIIDGFRFAVEDGLTGPVVVTVYEKEGTVCVPRRLRK